MGGVVRTREGEQSCRRLTSKSSTEFPLSAGGITHGYVNKSCLEFGAGTKFRLDGPIYLLIGIDYLHSEYVNPLLRFRGQNSLRITASVEY